MDPTTLPQLGIYGAFMAIFVFVIRYLLGDFSRRLEAISEHFIVISLMVTSLHETLLRHDSQVRGLNPSTPLDNEHIKIAIENFEQTSKKLENIRALLEEMRTLTHVGSRGRG